MSQHPSLRALDKNKAHRSVLKRPERLSILKEKELWKKDDSIYGLPKVKVIQIKMKKEKAAAAAETPAEGAAPAAAPAAAPKAAEAKPAAGSKKK